MSFDLIVREDKIDGPTIDSLAFNYTSNVLPIIRLAATPVGYRDYWRNGHTVLAWPFLRETRHVAHTIHSRWTEFSKLDPENGWGSAQDILVRLNAWSQKVEDYLDDRDTTRRFYIGFYS